MSARKVRTTPADMDADQRALYERIALGSRAAESAFPLVDSTGALVGPFDAMLLAPALGEALQAIGSALRFRGSLTDRAREFAILLVGHHYRSIFEIHAHEAIGRRLGLTDADLAALGERRPPVGASAYEVAVVDLVNKILRDADLDDASYHSAVTTLGEEGVFEVNVLVGYYALLATQLKIFAPEG